MRLIYLLGLQALVATAKEVAAPFTNLDVRVNDIKLDNYDKKNNRIDAQWMFGLTYALDPKAQGIEPGDHFIFTADPRLLVGKQTFGVYGVYPMKLMDVTNDGLTFTGTYTDAIADIEKYTGKMHFHGFFNPLTLGDKASSITATVGTYDRYLSDDITLIPSVDVSNVHIQGGGEFYIEWEVRLPQTTYDRLEFTFTLLGETSELMGPEMLPSVSLAFLYNTNEFNIPKHREPIPQERNDEYFKISYYDYPHVFKAQVTNLPVDERISLQIKFNGRAENNVRQRHLANAEYTLWKKPSDAADKWTLPGDAHGEKTGYAYLNCDCVDDDPYYPQRPHAQTTASPSTSSANYTTATDPCVTVTTIVSTPLGGDPETLTSTISTCSEPSSSIPKTTQTPTTSDPCVSETVFVTTPSGEDPTTVTVSTNICPSTTTEAPQTSQPKTSDPSITVSTITPTTEVSQTTVPGSSEPPATSNPCVSTSIVTSTPPNGEPTTYTVTDVCTTEVPSTEQPATSEPTPTTVQPSTTPKETLPTCISTVTTTDPEGNPSTTTVTTDHCPITTTVTTATPTIVTTTVTNCEKECVTIPVTYSTDVPPNHSSTVVTTIVHSKIVTLTVPCDPKETTTPVITKPVSGETTPVPQETESAPGSTPESTTTPEATKPVSGETTPIPQETEPVQETTKPVLETTESAPETTESVVESSNTPESTKPAPVTTKPVSGESTPVPQETEPTPETELTPKTTEHTPETTEHTPETTKPSPESTIPAIPHVTTVTTVACENEVCSETTMIITTTTTACETDCTPEVPQAQVTTSETSETPETSRPTSGVTEAPKHSSNVPEPAKSTPDTPERPTSKTENPTEPTSKPENPTEPTPKPENPKDSTPKPEAPKSTSKVPEKPAVSDIPANETPKTSKPIETSNGSPQTPQASSSSPDTPEQANFASSISAPVSAILLPLLAFIL